MQWHIRISFKGFRFASLRGTRHNWSADTVSATGRHCPRPVWCNLIDAWLFNIHIFCNVGFCHCFAWYLINNLCINIKLFRRNQSTYTKLFYYWSQYHINSILLTPASSPAPVLDILLINFHQFLILILCEMYTL